MGVSCARKQIKHMKNNQTLMYINRMRYELCASVFQSTCLLCSLQHQFTSITMDFPSFPLPFCVHFFLLFDEKSGKEKLNQMNYYIKFSESKEKHVEKITTGICVLG